MLALCAFVLAASLPAADSTHYIVLNHGRLAGEMHVVTTDDSVVVRYRYQDRQRGPRFQTVYRLGANRRVLALETRSVTAEGTLGPVTQHVDFFGDSLRSVSSGDTTLMRDDPTSYFVLDNTSPFDDALLARFLLSRPGQRSRLYPDGTGRAEVVADTTVSVDGAQRRIRLVFIDGLSTSTDAVWLDDANRLFASGAGWFITVPRAAAGVLPALREI
jgi:hypothetical protein